MRAIGLAAAAAFGALLAVAPPAANAGNARAPRAPLAPRAGPVWALCPEALADGTPVDPRTGEALAALAAGIRWDGTDGITGGPTRCHRKVRLHCGPDVDRDGDRESIVEITSRELADGQSCEDTPISGGDEAPPVVRYTFLVSRHASTWRAVARLAVAIDDGGGEAALPSAYFVRRPGGKLGVRVDRQVAQGACEVGGYEVFALRAGALVSLGAGDLSPPCVPCGCK